MTEEAAIGAGYLAIFERFAAATMIAPAVYVSNLELVEGALRSKHLAHGCIVECGTWRGGMAAGLMTLCGPERHYYFFDSFEGLPPPGSMDGKKAQQWVRNTSDPLYFDNCTASLAEFSDTIARVDVPSDRIHIYPGFFDATFPTAVVPDIAVLRLDADWFESTMQCFEKFWSLLLPGALVLIDDYYHWQGCRMAVHKYLATNALTEAIRQSPCGVAYLIKD